EVCPVVNPTADEAATIEAIKNLDLSHLKDFEAQELRNLLMKHRLVFNNRPGICKAALHKINLVEGFQPRALKAYRIPEALRAEVDRQIDQLLEDGKIRKSNSCFCPSYCVYKKG